MQTLADGSEQLLAQFELLLSDSRSRYVAATDEARWLDSSRG